MNFWLVSERAEEEEEGEMDTVRCGVVVEARRNLLEARIN